MASVKHILHREEIQGADYFRVGGHPLGTLTALQKTF
jgi:hypothetical protein